MTITENCEPCIKEVLEGYPREQRHALAIMQDIQKKFNHLPRESLFLLSDYLKVPVSKLYGMATFYRALSLKEKGENIIRVCDGTACHIRLSSVIIGEIEKLLNIRPGDTTKDGKFSLETVNCLGSCALAPVMVVNGDYYGNVTADMVGEILSKYGGPNNDGK